MPERSHYDVLGVSPAAKPEVVRRAYLRQARRWHPDRPSGDSEKMRAVNRAWQILGDPRSRAAYDRNLARSALGPTVSARHPGPSGPASSPRPAGAPPRPPASPLEVVGIRWRWISLAAVALVAGAVILILAAISATDDSDPPSLITVPAPVSQSGPEPGGCFLIGATALIAVGCDQPHEGLLVEWIPLGAPCPPDTELHWVRSARQAVCYHPPSG